MAIWLPTAKEQDITGDGVFIPKKPLPKAGIKKNQVTITLIKPKIMPFIRDALHISYSNKIKKNNEYIIATE